MPTIELPEFGAAQTNENEPTDALKASGWADGDQPPASVANWIARATYDSLRGMLGLHIAALANSFTRLDRPTPGSAYVINAFGIDSLDGTVLNCSYNSGATTLAIYRSTDNGIRYSSVYTDVAGTAADHIAIVPGVYALSVRGSNSYVDYASYPYTTWAGYAVTWGGAIVDSLTADIGDGHGPSLLLLTDAGSIWVASATSAPTSSGSWTEYDISSVIPIPTSFALDPANGRLVVAGTNGTPDALTAYCDVADGVTAADFSTPVNHGLDSAQIAYNGTRFAILVKTASLEEIWHSPDGATWTEAGILSAEISATNQVLLGDSLSGNFFVFDGETASAACHVVASRDAEVWSRVTTDAQNIYIDGKRGVGPKLHPLTYRLMAVAYDIGTPNLGYLMSTI